jgi:hypothetical protein
MVHPANPRLLSFGVGVITTRWLYVLMAATSEPCNGQLITDETLRGLDLKTIDSRDIERIRVHLRDSLRNYELGVQSRCQGAFVSAKLVIPEGLKDDLKDFNAIGEGLVERLRAFREGGFPVLGSLIISLAHDRPGTSDFDQTEELALALPGSSTGSCDTATPSHRVFAQRLRPELQGHSPSTED